MNNARTVSYFVLIITDVPKLYGNKLVCGANSEREREREKERFCV